MYSFQSQFLMNSIRCIRLLDKQENKMSPNMSKSGGIIRYSSPPPPPPRIDGHAVSLHACRDYIILHISFPFRPSFRQVGRIKVPEQGECAVRRWRQMKWFLMSQSTSNRNFRKRNDWHVRTMNQNIEHFFILTRRGIPVTMQIWSRIEPERSGFVVQFL
jgi:hypothetical protein